MSQSTMVWAVKYRLLTPISITKGTFRKDGQKEALDTGKLVPRQWVEDRNSMDNNELYEIDEERTLEIMQEREKNIAKNNANDKFKNLSVAEALLIATGNQEAPKVEPVKVIEKPAPAKVEKVEEPVVEESVEEKTEVEATKEKSLEDMTVEELRTYCDDNFIKYDSRVGKAKLLETIKNAG